MMKSERCVVSITFDDGRLTALTEGARILEKYGKRGTFYIITDAVGTDNEHGGYGNWEDIRRVASAGHEIGNHSHTHALELKDWSAEEQKKDITRAQELLATHGISASTFAYPYGYVSSVLQHSIINLGFLAARTVERGVNTAATDPFLLRAFSVEDTHGLADIEQEVQSAIAENAWLILCFHHIDDRTFISTPPDLFEKMIAGIVELGVDIVPLGTHIKELQGYHAV